MSQRNIKWGLTRICIDFKGFFDRLGNFPQILAKPLYSTRNQRFSNEYEDGLVVAFTTNGDQVMLRLQ